jgi:prepilin-type N-terminal cleavage/methylation domain-containing protein
MRQNKNAGFTLVELIIVVVIISILSAGTVIGVSAIYNANVDSASRKLVSILMGTRQEAILRENGSVRMELYQDTNGDYYAATFFRDALGDHELENHKIGNSFLKLKVQVTGSAQIVISQAAGVEASFHFEKSSGGLQENYSDIFVEGSQTKNIIIIKETERSFIN